MKNHIYLDYNATTPLVPEVWNAMEPFFREHFGNPSSLHQYGRRPSKALREARKQVAALIGCEDENEIMFTSGGTESNNAAIRSCLAAQPHKRKIITSTVEHSSVLKLCAQLEKEGFQICRIPVDSAGMLDLNVLEQSIDDQTALVSLMAANNETGVLFPIESISKIVKARGAYLHLDAVQAIGKIPVNVKNTLVDYLSISAHKLYGPKGSGALFARKGAPFYPLILGGAQERGRRAGTENVPGIVGAGEACRLAQSRLALEAERLKQLRDEFESIIKRQLGAICINGESSPRLPNTSSVQFIGIEAEALLLALDQQGICVSSGSACMSGANDPSHVLKSMGRTDEAAKQSLRFSFGLLTNGTEIQALVKTLTEVIHRIKQLDPAQEHFYQRVN